VTAGSPRGITCSMGQGLTHDSVCWNRVVVICLLLVRIVYVISLCNMFVVGVCCRDSALPHRAVEGKHIHAVLVIVVAVVVVDAI
jgi:chloramphenicol 3-O-phosphotransferase